MDLSYILLNTIVYGTIALFLGSVFAYYKYFNFSIGMFFISSTYFVYYLYNNGLTIGSLVFLISMFSIFFLSNSLIVKSFKNIKQRDLFGLIFTIGITIFFLSFLRLIFGADLISINSYSLDVTTLFIILIFLFIFSYYFMNYSYVGKIFKGIYKDSNVVKSLGFKIDNFLFIYMFILSVIVIIVSYLNLLSTNIRVSDETFFLIKGIGIIVIVGISRLEFVYIGALLYVLSEYLLFIKLGLPISYKESFILIIILFVLFFKPSGLFSLKSRNI